MSVPSTTTVYFITGANRGIGYGLTERLAARPDTLVFATARDPSKADKLQQLAKQHSNLRVVKLSVDSDEDHATAAMQVEAEAGRVDVVIANAGIANMDSYVPIEHLAINKLREHFEVNTVGPVRLFSALFSLLNRSLSPKFVVVSSAAGSIGAQSNLASWHLGVYGTSKAALNFLTQRIHLEHPNITAFPLSPAWVQTDMGNAGAVAIGLKEAPMTLEQCVTDMTKLVDEATRDTHSGRFWSAESGKELPW